MGRDAADVLREDGIEALRRLIDEAPEIRPDPEPDPEPEPEPEPANDEQTDEAGPYGDFTDDVPLARAWPTLRPEALPGLAGRVVAAATADSEADPAAVLMTFLAWFGAAVGNGPRISIGEKAHCARLFVAIVGATARARKGTSKAQAGRLMREAQEGDAAGAPACPYTSGPLSSGEGLIYAVRDGDDSGAEDADPGVTDKRLIVIEEELGAALRAMQRQGNTLSTALRDFWDASGQWDRIAPITKSSRIGATNPHVAIVGHITAAELGDLLASNDLHNGLANRFLWACARRTRQVSRPKPIPDDTAQALAGEIAAALAVGRVRERMTLTPQAWALWDRLYPRLTADRPGAWGAATARAEAQTLRLALLYALLDQAEHIDVAQLKSGAAVWQYCQNSASYVFAEAIEESGDGRQLLDALRAAPNQELTQTQIGHAVFKKHKSRRELTALLGQLQESGRITSDVRKGDAPRAVTYWRLTAGFGD